MGKSFTTAAKRRETITFSIDDDDFHFDPPKLAKAMLPILDGSDSGDEDRMAATKAMWDWLRAGLPQDEYKRLTARMDDGDDEFDVEDLVEVVRYLVSEVSGRPSTKQPAS